VISGSQYAALAKSQLEQLLAVIGRKPMKQSQPLIEKREAPMISAEIRIRGEIRTLESDFFHCNHVSHCSDAMFRMLG